MLLSRELDLRQQMGPILNISSLQAKDMVAVWKTECSRARGLLMQLPQKTRLPLTWGDPHTWRRVCDDQWPGKDQEVHVLSGKDMFFIRGIQLRGLGDKTFLHFKGCIVGILYLLLFVLTDPPFRGGQLIAFSKYLLKQ